MCRCALGLTVARGSHPLVRATRAGPIVFMPCRACRADIHSKPGFITQRRNLIQINTIWIAQYLRVTPRVKPFQNPVIGSITPNFEYFPKVAENWPTMESKLRNMIDQKFLNHSLPSLSVIKFLIRVENFANTSNNYYITTYRKRRRKKLKGGGCQSG